MTVPLYNLNDEPVRGATFTFSAALTSQADTDIFKTDPTLADGDIVIYKDGVLDGNIDALPADIGSSGIIPVVLSIDEMTANRVDVLFHDVAGAEWQDLLVTIFTKVAVAAGTSDYAGGAVSSVTGNVGGSVDSVIDDVGITQAGADKVWAYASRTLTQTAAQVAATLAGSAILIHRGDLLTVNLTGIGTTAGYVSIDFTVKANKEDLDASSIICIRKNASGLNDGLLYLNGAAPSSAALGLIAITDPALGNLTITLYPAVTSLLNVAAGLHWDIQYIFSVTDVQTKTEGVCDIAADVRRAIS
jgi:hypothetical protein